MATDVETTSHEAMTVELRLAVFERLVRSYGWTSNAEIAAAIGGISERQVRRIRNGKSRPGLTFIAGLLNAAEEAGFRRLFRVVPESAPIGKD